MGARSRCVTATVLRLISLAALLTASAARAEEPLQPTEGFIASGGIVAGYTTDTAGNHSVNGYWINGQDGLILIDTHWRLSDARCALSAMRERTDAPIRAVLVTHPHSDHFGGLPVFMEAARAEGAEAAYYTSAWTARSIAHDEQGFIANRQDQFGEDFAPRLPEPTHIIEDGQPIEVAGVVIEPAILRQNEAVESVLFHVPSARALFTGDLVGGQTLPVLYQGGLDSWISQLKGLRARFPDVETVFPGHGRPGPADKLIDGQIAVLEMHRDLIAAALENDGDVDRAEREEIKDRIEARFPDWRTTAGISTRRLLIEQNIEWTLRGWRVAGAGEGNAREFRQ